MAYKRLGELLVAAGTISEEELARGLALQKGTKERLGTVLISNNIITEEKLIEALQMQLGIEFVDLTKVNIPTELAQALPKNIAKQYQVVPVRAVKDELYLAMSDPMNFYAIEEVRKAVRKKVVPMVATAAAVERAIQVLYGNEGAAKAIEEMKREAAASQDVSVPDAAFVSNQLGDDTISNAPTIRLVNAIIERAITERASDIHLEPRENELQVRMRIDGLMRYIMTVPRDLQGSVISRIKIMSSLDIAEHRIPQDGRFNVKMKDKDIDLRVSTLPTVYGEKVVIRLLRKSAATRDKTAIGLRGENVKRYDMILLSDEIHGEFVDPQLGRPFLPFAPIADEAGCRWVIANAPNKAFNTAGLMTAYIITPFDDLRERIDRTININEICDINCFSFVALQAAYTPEGEDWLNALVRYIYDGYRYFRREMKAAFPDLPIAPLEGTYLAWMDVTSFPLTSDEISTRLRAEQKVWINGGEMYGQQGFMRINLATQRARLVEGTRRIIDGLRTLSL